MAAALAAAVQLLTSLSGPLALLLGAAVIWAGCDPIARWRYWHIPGPRFGWPFLGTLNLESSTRQHETLRKDWEQYGPIFKMWFGPVPWVIVCDADAIRKLAYRCIDRFELPHTMLGSAKRVMDNNLVILRSDLWKLMRKAWDPAILHRSSLEGYAPLMQECGEQLLERLEGVRQRGEVVDIWQELSVLTLDSVGTCAFGIKFQASSSNVSYDAATPQRPTYGGEGPGVRQPLLGRKAEQDHSEEIGPRLLAALQDFFRSIQLTHASKWLVGVVALPSLAALVRMLAHLLPDQDHSRAVQAHATMLECSRRIISASRLQRLLSGTDQQQPAPGSIKAEPVGASTAGGADCGGASVPGGVSGTSMPGAERGRPIRSFRGVLPGSFVAQLEAWNAKHGGSEDVSDELLAAQVITFLLAGYETTANAMSFLVYHLAGHHEAQQKLQQELDTLLGGRKPTLDDLPKLEYLQACIKETLRLNPGTAIMTRKTAPKERLTVLGKAIPPGTQLALFVYGVHHDPQHWKRPQDFLPERFLPETGGNLGPFHEYAYLPFGAGARKCVGYKFAEQEMMLVGAALFQRFFFSRPQGAPPMELRTGITLAPVNGVRVLVHGRPQRE